MERTFFEKKFPSTVIPRLDRGIQRQPSSNKLDPAVKPRDDRLVKVCPRIDHLEHYRHQF
ncbi:MAG: hypothetical protein HYW48_06505 [Deltaproteobacteria bacterium]|nr:hypothetical protein [Deltaproteobacteria bacterium]